MSDLWWGRYPIDWWKIKAIALIVTVIAICFLGPWKPLGITPKEPKDVTCVYDGKPFANGKSDDKDFADWCERSIKAFDARLCRGCECQAGVDKDGGIWVAAKICPEKKPVLAEEFAEGSGVAEVAK